MKQTIFNTKVFIYLMIAVLTVVFARLSYGYYEEDMNL